MSITLTIEAPEVASYVTHRGVGFREEFAALLTAYVKTRLSFDDERTKHRKTGAEFARVLGQMRLEDDALDLSRTGDSTRVEQTIRKRPITDLKALIKKPSKVVSLAEMDAARGMGGPL